MDTLIDSIQNKIPIIDHHAHNLLTPSNHHVRPYLAITSEASGSALNSVFSSLAHIRAVKQLANILHCEPSWEVVKAHVEAKNEDQVGWARRCFRGIETVLIDDGLDDDVVHPLRWHDQLVRSRCKRILRIERVAEKLLSAYIKSDVNSAADSKSILAAVKKEFTIAITNATNDPDIAGFKSVICYRTGLAIRHVSDVDVCKAIESITQLQTPMDKIRHFQNDYLNPYFVHLTARIIEQSSTRKPFQFHTGLGYNDIVLSLSSPAHLQDFIKFYPSVPIVLLHASYPFIKEAGYLASTYENVYLDIGEVFPMVSQEGQEKVVREALELCPSEKLSWSTDGRWFPETFLLAVLQVKDAFQKVSKRNLRKPDKQFSHQSAGLM